MSVMNAVNVCVHKRAPEASVCAKGLSDMDCPCHVIIKQDNKVDVVLLTTYELYPDGEVNWTGSECLRDLGVEEAFTHLHKVGFPVGTADEFKTLVCAVVGAINNKHCQQ